MKPTRKAESEGEYLFATTQNKLYCTQRETDSLLGKYYLKNQTYEHQN